MCVNYKVRYNPTNPTNPTNFRFQISDFGRHTTKLYPRINRCDVLTFLPRPRSRGCAAWLNDRHNHQRRWRRCSSNTTAWPSLPRPSVTIFADGISSPPARTATPRSNSEQRSAGSLQSVNRRGCLCGLCRYFVAFRLTQVDAGQFIPRTPGHRRSRVGRRHENAPASDRCQRRRFRVQNRQLRSPAWARQD